MRAKRRWGRYFFIALVLVIMVCGGVIGICNLVVKQQAKGRIYAKVNEIPYRKVGLVLGTIPIVHNHENQYYHYRMDAAAEL